MKHSKYQTVMVVEDEMIVALDLAQTVLEFGYRVDGPYSGTGQAFGAMARQLPDLAILDVNVADGEVYPLADALSEARVPIIFHSGQAAPAELMARYPGAQARAKPCSPTELVQSLVTATSEGKKS